MHTKQTEKKIVLMDGEIPEILLYLK